MERKCLAASIVVLAVFAIGLVGFYVLSDGLPDGLDRALEDHGAVGEQAYNAPLSYGDGYGSALLMGGIGFAITLLVVLGIMKLRKAAHFP